MIDEQKFLTGINYWPARKAMYWWRDFEVEEVADDFNILADNNFRLVRIFLTWEDFQPTPDKISIACVDNLRKTADLASTYGLELMPTFFCGHMSGINWMPEWMLAPGEGGRRFPVFSNDQARWVNIRNCYTDKKVIDAQLFQIRTVVSALRDHEAIYAYDLGNEASNWVIPPQRTDAQRWLESMTAQINICSPETRITLGMHAEDLEEDRHLWPQDAAAYCNFLSMHGYPFYLPWVDDPLDIDLVPFLAIITAWLGQKKVLFQEFGIPTQSVVPPPLPADYASTCQCPLWSEDEAAHYYDQVLKRLAKADAMGGMAWCYADYVPLLWEKHPLGESRHERHFGMFRHDGNPKPAAEVFRHWEQPLLKNNLRMVTYPWLNEKDRDNFYHNPRNNLSRLYQKYKEWLKGGP